MGSGLRKLPGFINIDIRPEVSPDLIHDVREGLPFDDSSIEEIRAFDFLEHIESDKIPFVIEEIYRVLKHDGRFEALVPSTDGRGAFMDFTHKSFWNINSWLYFTEPDWKHLYNVNVNFRVEHLADETTSGAMRIIHTHVVLYAVKN